MQVCRQFDNYLDYETIIKLYESEKVLLPLMIHENYIKKVLYKSTDPWENTIYDLVKISDSIFSGRVKCPCGPLNRNSVPTLVSLNR